jgi:hypothetical protein
MDDPTRRCENDTDNRTRYSGALVPKQGPHFFACFGAQCDSPLRHIARFVRDEFWLSSFPSPAPASRWQLRAR